MRDLRAEANALARPGEWIRLRENVHEPKVWAAWDVLYRAPGATRGRVRFTLIHRAGTRF